MVRRWVIVVTGLCIVFFAFFAKIYGTYLAETYTDDPNDTDVEHRPYAHALGVAMKSLTLALVVFGAIVIAFGVYYGKLVEQVMARSGVEEKGVEDTED